MNIEHKNLLPTQGKIAQYLFMRYGALQESTCFGPTPYFSFDSSGKSDLCLHASFISHKSNHSFARSFELHFLRKYHVIKVEHLSNIAYLNIILSE